MGAELRLSIGQHSDRGRKESNQDFHGACLPREPQLSTSWRCCCTVEGTITVKMSSSATASPPVPSSRMGRDAHCANHSGSVRRIYEPGETI